jgi:crotonobetainyl-CoA:carnitine CoA-transferase CaiB-like acyl-CoA transferase
MTLFYFLAINRNKKSLVLDLGTPAGRDVFLDLVAQSDVVWENVRPGVMERLGVLTTLLKYPAERLAALRREGVIG